MFYRAYNMIPLFFQKRSFQNVEFVLKTFISTKKTFPFFTHHVVLFVFLVCYLPTWLVFLFCFETQKRLFHRSWNTLQTCLVYFDLVFEKHFLQPSETAFMVDFWTLAKIPFLPKVFILKWQHSFAFITAVEIIHKL